MPEGKPEETKPPIGKRVAPRRAAANARAPNRQPRWKQQAKMASVEGRKRVFLDRLQAGDTQGEAAHRIKTKLALIWVWMASDSEFVFAYHKARAFALEAAKERLEGLQPKAVGVVDKALENKDMKLSSGVALKVLQGQGLLVERGEVEHSGEITLRITADELAAIYRRSRQGLLQAGGEPLGLADGGGNGERPAAGSGVSEVPTVATPVESPPSD